jgi:hypothetical protein
MLGCADTQVNAGFEPISSRIVGNSEMYGPPLRRKQNVGMSRVGLRKCIRPLLE